MPINLDDPDILRTADQNHHPEEIWVYEIGGSHGMVVCAECKLNYPCPTRLEIRERTGPRWRGKPVSKDNPVPEWAWVEWRSKWFPE